MIATVMKVTKRRLVAALLIAMTLLMTPFLAQAQDLGHGYELEAAPIREGEKPVIPLDTKDPSYNLWCQIRDFSEDPKREAGIINLKQYNFGMSYNAIPTFFSLPVALTPDDLRASNVDVAILGAVSDMGTGIAMRKKGLAEPHYLDPLSKSHGQGGK